MKVGDYVRTKDGIIGKIERKNLIGYNDWLIDTLYYNDDEIIDDWTCGVKEYDIIKSSPNIIDLIEYNDILKIIYEGKEYICKVINVAGIRGVQLTSTLSVGLGIVEAGIKSIVTKEMFSQIEYKVGEK